MSYEIHNYVNLPFVWLDVHYLESFWHVAYTHSPNISFFQMSTPSEPYVPFFHKAEHEARDSNPPRVPRRDQSAKQAGYDNQGNDL